MRLKGSLEVALVGEAPARADRCAERVIVIGDTKPVD